MTAILWEPTQWSADGNTLIARSSATTNSDPRLVDGAECGAYGEKRIEIPEDGLTAEELPGVLNFLERSARQIAAEILGHGSSGGSQ